MVFEETLGKIFTEPTGQICVNLPKFSFTILFLFHLMNQNILSPLLSVTFSP